MAKGFSLDVTEVRDLAADLAVAGGAVGPIAVAVQRKYAALIVQEARRIVPVRTGALRDSIGIAPGGEAGSLGMSGVTIEAGEDYAGYVEFGTSRMSARPYMRPALRKYAKDYREDLIDAAAGLVGTKGLARGGLKGKSLFRGSSSFSLGSALGRR